MHDEKESTYILRSLGNPSKPKGSDPLKKFLLMSSSIRGQALKISGAPAIKLPDSILSFIFLQKVHKQFNNNTPIC